jgi:hypothetical protein
MEPKCHHIPIKEAADRLKERLKAIGFKEIHIEDDDPGFKNFFAKSDRLFEDSFFTIQILLYEPCLSGCHPKRRFPWSKAAKPFAQ